MSQHERHAWGAAVDAMCYISFMHLCVELKNLLWKFQSVKCDQEEYIQMTVWDGYLARYHYVSHFAMSFLYTSLIQAKVQSTSQLQVLALTLPSPLFSAVGRRTVIPCPVSVLTTSKSAVRMCLLHMYILSVRLRFFRWCTWDPRNGLNMFRMLFFFRKLMIDYSYLFEK